MLWQIMGVVLLLLVLFCLLNRKSPRRRLMDAIKAKDLTTARALLDSGLSLDFRMKNSGHDAKCRCRPESPLEKAQGVKYQPMIDLIESRLSK